jgi:hypothetical protein
VGVERTNESDDDVVNTSTLLERLPLALTPHDDSLPPLYLHMDSMIGDPVIFMYIGDLPLSDQTHEDIIPL